MIYWESTWGFSSVGSPVEAVTHPSEKLNKKYSAHPFIWGYSSAGRALEWHSRGQRFDPAYLHQTRKALKTLRFQGFSFLRAAQSKRHFSAAPEPAIPPCNIRLGKKILLFNLFLQNIDLVCGCHSAACIRTQAGSTPEDPMDANDAAPPKLHTVNQECRQFRKRLTRPRT